MSQLRDIYGGVITDAARETWARLEADRGNLPSLRPTSRMTVCTCVHMYGSESCVPDVTKLPVHSTCGTIVDEHGERVGGMCWCWTGCDDPICDHPACGDRGWREFREAWAQTHDDREDLIVWTTPWLPWVEAGRHAELLDEWRDGQHRVAKEPNLDKLLRALETGKPVDALRVGGGDYLAMELALVDGGLTLESRNVAVTTLDHVAYSVARGRTIDDLGGSIHGEIRLAQTLDLADAPVGYQGALFA